MCNDYVYLIILQKNIEILYHVDVFLITFLYVIVLILLLIDVPHQDK